MEVHEIANLFPMMDEVDFENLVNDITTNGYDEDRPIILYEGKILDGRNRYKACQGRLIEPKFKEYTGKDPVGYVISRNLNRRHLNASQRACIAVNALPLFEKEAKKRHGINTPIRPLMDGLTLGRSDEQVGMKYNVSRGYVAEAKRLKEQAPDKFEAVMKGEKNIAEVRKEEKIEARKQKIAEQEAAIEKGNIQQPEGNFDVIVIDPPWDYQTPYNPDNFMGRTANPYPVITIEEVKAIQLPAKENCVLWLWTTHSQIRRAWEIMEHWGFQYKAILIWDKESMGIGTWLRKQCEFCLMGIKGKPLWKGTGVRDIIREQRTSHSTKPETFYRMVEENCVGRKLEYFARKRREGWECYGDEVV